MLPSSRATGTAGAPETQGAQRYLRKPLASPFVFNSSVSLHWEQKVQTPRYMSFRHIPRPALWLQIPFLYPDYWNRLTVQASMPFQQSRMGQLLILVENFALLADPVLDTLPPSHPVLFSCFLSCIQSLMWTPKTGSLCTLGFSIWFHWSFYLKQ